MSFLCWDGRAPVNTREPAKYEPPISEFSSRSTVLFRSGRLKSVRGAELACFGKDDWIPDVQTCIYLPNSGRSQRLPLVRPFWPGVGFRCNGGAALDVGRRRSNLSPKPSVCRPAAQFCRLRSYCAGLAAATLATFCRQFHPITGPKCWRTSITLSYGTRYDRHGTLSYMTSFRHMPFHKIHLQTFRRSVVRN